MKEVGRDTPRMTCTHAAEAVVEINADANALFNYPDDQAHLGSRMPCILRK
jgi:hypothetical protein